MFHVVIAALFCNFLDVVAGVGQEELSICNTAVYDFIDTGYVKKTLVKFLKGAGAQIHDGCHFF